jgi:3'-phosphoadenosine 5'-phosphosulfate sulfotransferase (PAPS reductase)/FAD synthetase
VRPLHINTGIGIERTREFVRETCGDSGWSLREEKTTQSYEDLVLERGFPGPAMHGKMYNRLKERPIRRVVSEAKCGHSRTACVMIVSGIRHDESAIRTGYQRAISKVGSQVWVNPLYWSTIDVFRAYRERHKLQPNPVSAKLGFSGECLCGAHADKGELDRIEFVCPQTAAYLRDLESRVRQAGFPWGYESGPPRWWLDQQRGQGLLGDWFDDAPQCKPGPMCHSCEKGKQ